MLNAVGARGETKLGAGGILVKEGVVHYLFGFLIFTISWEFPW
jgi:hypothetical protein